MSKSVQGHEMSILGSCLLAAMHLEGLQYLVSTWATSLPAGSESDHCQTKKA